MPTKSIDVDYDLDDFDLDEIIDHLSWNSEELTKKQVSKIKASMIRKNQLLLVIL
jgi:hypothetical protein